MMRVKIKQADESRNTTTTLADDSELSVALEASTTYFVDITFTFTAGATPDFKWAYHYSGTLTRSIVFEGAREPAGTTSGGSGDNLGPPTNNNPTFFTTPTARALVGVAALVGGAHIRGVLVTNSAGNLKLQWAQNVSDASNVTVQAGSYIAIATQAEMEGTMVVKPANTDRTSVTTVSADPDLQFPTKANSKYICELLVVNVSGSSAPDWKFALHNAQTTQVAGHINNVTLENNLVFQTSSDSFVNGRIRNATFLTTPVEGAFVTSNLSNFNQIHIHFSLVQGGSADTLAFEWAQNVSSVAATTVLGASWLLCEEIIQP